MKKFRISAELFIITVVLTFSGCDLLNSLFGTTKPESPDSSTSLAQQVVDELGDTLSGTASQTVAQAVQNPGFSSTEISQIKQKAMQKITNDGYAKSSYLDQIVPSMVQGVGSYIEENSETLQSDKAKVLDLVQKTAKSSVNSMAKPERSANYEKQKKEALGVVAVAITETTQTAFDKESFTMAYKEVTKEFASDVILAFSDDSEAILKTVSATVTIETSDLAIISPLVEGTLQAVVETGENDNVKQALVQATVKGVMENTSKLTLQLPDLTVADVVTEVLTATVNVLANERDTTLLTEAAGDVIGTVFDQLLLEEGDITTITDAISKLPVKPEVTSVITGVVKTIQEEPAPTITGILQGTTDVLGQTIKITEPQTVTLKVIATDGTGSYTYLWEQTEGPTITVTAATTDTVSITLSTSGTYTFKVTVTNSGGYRCRSATVKIEAIFAISESSIKLVEDGLVALKYKDFDLAYTKFTAAYAKDSRNTDAKFWAALLNISAISTDPATVSLMKERIGIVGYPTNMNTLFSTTWFNSTYYGMKRAFYFAPEGYEGTTYIRGTIEEDSRESNFCYCYTIDDDGSINYDLKIGYTFTPNNTGTYYSDYYYIYDGKNHIYYDSWCKEEKTTNTVITKPLPAGYTRYALGDILDTANSILLPRLEVPGWATGMITDAGIPGQDASHLSINMYPLILAINIVNRNPNGLNSLIDGVLKSAFGSRLTTAIDMIDALPDTAAVAIPKDIIEAYSGSLYPLPAEIKINKAELKAFASSVQVVKSFVQLLASYNLDYPLSFLKTNWLSSDASATMLDSLFKQQNPIALGFMSNRSTSMRSTAKNTMLTALTAAEESLQIIINNWDNSLYISGMTGGTMNSFDPAYKTYVQQSKTMIGTLKDSISGATTLYVNPGALMGGNIEQLLSTQSGSGIPLKPSVLYDTDIFNISKLLECTGTSTGTGTAPEGIKILGVTVDVNGNLFCEKAQKGNEYDMLAVSINYSFYRQFIDIPPTGMPENPDNSGYYLIPTGTPPESTNTNAWNLINWIQGDPLN